ncbi:MAG: hypothetical protein PHO41_00960 [Eubacteriales bacterium]|nr:hypothetical protein [Eubacteriales bacterium]
MDAHRYDDIMHLPHPVSSVHPPMPQADRAAQFSPFAALTGYADAIDETARLTDARVELDEDGKSALDSRLQLLQNSIKAQPEVTVTYFQPDEKKTGGAYVTATGAVQKIDGYRRLLCMTDGTAIPINDIYAIEGELFYGLDL